MDVVDNHAKEQLKRYIETVERLEEEKRGIAEHVSETFAEAKANGFDVKTMRKILKLRKMDQNDLQEQEFLLETYKEALGMTPPARSFEENLPEAETETKTETETETETAEEVRSEVA